MLSKSITGIFGRRKRKEAPKEEPAQTDLERGYKLAAARQKEILKELLEQKPRS
ncbi:hypothetical protein EV13_1495 [Prochlorococcus sp. MIT 0702]|nr:hypothetical protein EV13_1495 [Prochlorococcus sp. MIT 0702]